MKLTGYTYVCNNLTSFECEADATTGNGKYYESTKFIMRKIREIMPGELISGGF